MQRSFLRFTQDRLRLLRMTALPDMKGLGFLSQSVLSRMVDFTPRQGLLAPCVREP